MGSETETLLRKIAQAIIDKKGFNLVGLDVRGISTMTDFFVIAEGNVERHVKALARVVEEAIEEFGDQVIHIEGLDVGEWVVIDCVTVVIHLFTPTMRDRYHLEQLWHEAKLIEIPVATTEKIG